MKHTIITITIATPGKYDPDEIMLDGTEMTLLDALDELLAEWPVEFEDWSVEVS